MALPDHIQDKEQQKFVETPGGDVAIRTYDEDDAPATASEGRTVVAAAGTAVQLHADLAARKVIITAETNNTGIITVGGSGVIADLATREGTPLLAGDHFEITVPGGNLNTIYLDSTVNGDGVTYTYLI